MIGLGHISNSKD